MTGAKESRNVELIVAIASLLAIAIATAALAH
jgi:hypothetical protein